MKKTIKGILYDSTQATPLCRIQLRREGGPGDSLLCQGRALLRGAGCGRKGVFPVPYVQRGHGGLDGALPAGCERDLARPAELTGS